GSAIARRWFDVDGVNAVAELTNSAVALAVQQIAKEKGQITLFTGPATTRLTNEDCSSTGFHWAFDTYSQAVGTGRAVVAEGGKSWFLLVADYAFGHQMASDLSKVVKTSGGTVVGEVRHPLNSSDFSSFLLRAQSSKAQIVGLASAGADTINSVKQAAEYRIAAGGQKLAGLVVVISDIDAVGPDDGQRAGLHDGFLLGSGRGVSGLVQTVLRADRPDAWNGSGRNLFSSAALSQSDGGSGDGGRQSSRRQNKGVAGRRFLRQGTSARGRPHDARYVSRRGQDAERIQGKMGLLQGSPPHSGRRGGPAAERKQGHWGQSDWDYCVSWFLEFPASPCSLIRTLQRPRLLSGRCRRPRPLSDSRSMSSTPAATAKSMRPSQPLFKGKMPQSWSSPTRCSLTDAFNLSPWQRVMRFLQSM